MIDIRPFRGVRYSLAQDELERVLAPPYDVIAPRYADELRARHPRNVVRLILNARGDEAGYAESGAAFAIWQAEGTLRRDDLPAVYLLEQTFQVAGLTYERLGLIARFRAEDYVTGRVLPHEHTRAAAKQDRYFMLKATRANFSPIFLMFADAEQRFLKYSRKIMAAAEAVRYVDDNGVAQRLWPVTDARQIAELQGLAGGGIAYIADGHHRYATALRYRDEVGPHGAWTMGYFTPTPATGLVILPYHRILKSGPPLADVRERLAPHFEITETADANAAAERVQVSRAPYAFGWAAPDGQAWVAEIRPQAIAGLAVDAAPVLKVLDTHFLHNLVLPRLLGLDDSSVEYVHSFVEAAEALAERRCHQAILLRPTPVEQILAVAEARESMPAKSTFFHPKLPSGLVIHPLADTNEIA
ncbi:MAG: DUF1015 domain-containing protein [Vicinamibacteria bacterium]|nr:DUF1015 domain-containing protein [Vicinamibacteria bacterium]